MDTKYDSLRGGWCSKDIAGSFEAEWECRNLQGGDGKFFLNLLGLRWEIDPSCDFGMIYSVGNKP